MCVGHVPLNRYYRKKKKKKKEKKNGLSCHLAAGQNQWDPILGVFGAPPILEPILYDLAFDPWPTKRLKKATARVKLETSFGQTKCPRLFLQKIWDYTLGKLQHNPPNKQNTRFYL